jgi:Fic family protein
MTHASETRIPCSKDTRDAIKEVKDAGETYDLLLRRMVAQYEPQSVLDRSDAERAAE